MIDFNKKDRYIIAEFVFSYQTDVLIKDDAQKLIDVLDKHGLIEDAQKFRQDVENNTGGAPRRLDAILVGKIPSEQGNAIMQEYYGREKYSLKPGGE